MFQLEFGSKALDDLKSLPKHEAGKILDKLKVLLSCLNVEGLAALRVSNVKRLTYRSPEYRLRVGNYRILFEVRGNDFVVYRVLHRSKAYK